MPYVAHGLKKLAVSHLVGGSGDLASAGSALFKCQELKDIQQRYFHDTTDYKGGDIAENDALQAIKYARSKKLSKAERKGVIGGVKFGAFVAGAATGATLGSVVPVAGNIAGGAAGAFTFSAVASAGVTVADRTKRLGKYLYKKARHTQGEHRTQAAHALYYCFMNLPTLAAGQAAEEALEILLQEEYEAVMNSKDPEKRIADRLRSN